MLLFKKDYNQKFINTKNKDMIEVTDMKVETTRKVYMHADFDKVFEGRIDSIEDFKNSVITLLEKGKKVLIETEVATKKRRAIYNKYMFMSDDYTIDYSYITLFNIVSIPLRVINVALIALMAIILSRNSIDSMTLTLGILAVDLVYYGEVLAKAGAGVVDMILIMLYTANIEYIVMSGLMSFNINPVFGYILGAIIAETIMKIVAIINVSLKNARHNAEAPQPEY